MMLPDLTQRAVTAAVAVALTWTGHAGADDDETRRVEGLSFERVLVADNIRVEIVQEDEYLLRYKASSDDRDREPFYISRGNTLVLRKSRRGDVRFRVSMPSFERISVKGSGSVYVKPFVLDDPTASPVKFSLEGSGDLRLYGFEGPEAELSLQGSGDLKAVNLKVGELTAVVSGSGELYLGEVDADIGRFTVTGSGDLEVTKRGYVRDLGIDVVGAGDADLEVVECEDAVVNVVGSGDVSLGLVGQHLNAAILGSGDISYRGEPTVERTVFGSGEIRTND